MYQENENNGTSEKVLLNGVYVCYRTHKLRACFYHEEKYIYIPIPGAEEAVKKENFGFLPEGYEESEGEPETIISKKMPSTLTRFLEIAKNLKNDDVYEFRNADLKSNDPDMKYIHEYSKITDVDGHTFYQLYVTPATLEMNLNLDNSISSFTESHNDSQ